MKDIVAIKSENIYQLPFDGEVDIRPAPYHYSPGKNWMKYAIDFALDIGTPILAAADGIIYTVVDRYGYGG